MRKIFFVLNSNIKDENANIFVEDIFFMNKLSGFGRV